MGQIECRDTTEMSVFNQIGVLHGNDEHTMLPFITAIIIIITAKILHRYFYRL